MKRYLIAGATLALVALYALAQSSGGNRGGVSFPLLGPNGSAAAPSFAFSNCTTCGLYQQSNFLELSALGGVQVSINGGSQTLTIVATGTSFNSGAGIAIGAAAPTISSGFGTSPSVVNPNSTASFQINVGTGAAASTGTIGLPTAAHGWNCTCTDITTNSATVFACKQTGAGSTTTAPIGQFTAAGAAQAWNASDILNVSCFGF